MKFFAVALFLIVLCSAVFAQSSSESGSTEAAASSSSEGSESSGSSGSSSGSGLSNPDFAEGIENRLRQIFDVLAQVLQCQSESS